MTISHEARATEDYVSTVRIAELVDLAPRGGVVTGAPGTPMPPRARTALGRRRTTLSVCCQAL